MLDKKLQALFEPTVIGLGYELIGVERLSRGRQGTIVRLYLDVENEEGITLDDCSKVSYHVSGILDVEDPVAGDYVLEVSSPGLDRPLYTLAHFVRFIGRKINVKLSYPLEESNRRTFNNAMLRSVEDDTVTINLDGEEFVLPFNAIDKARLVPVVLKDK